LVTAVSSGNLRLNILKGIQFTEALAHCQRFWLRAQLGTQVLARFDGSPWQRRRLSFSVLLIRDFLQFSALPFFSLDAVIAGLTA
jgi:hypothetical protein